MSVQHVSRLLLQTNQAIIPAIGVLDASFTLFLIQVVLILSVCECLSWIGVIFHQPRVIFEILGGIVLGPSVLGNFTAFTHQLFPPGSLNVITIVAQLGLNFYIFIIGLEVDYSIFLYSLGKTSAIALTSMIVPFALGIAISPLLFAVVQAPKDSSYSEFTNQEGTRQFVSFFVFIGTALSITAFPVLARIINETPLKLTKIGGVTLSAAAINDAVAWVLLVIAISLSRAASSLSSLYLILSMLAYTLTLFTLGRYLLCKLVLLVENGDIDEMKKQWMDKIHQLLRIPNNPATPITGTAATTRNILPTVVGDIGNRDTSAIPRQQNGPSSSSSGSTRVINGEGRATVSLQHSPSVPITIPSFNLEKRLHHLFVIIIILFLSSAYFVSLLGIDAIIGSLLFGIIVPRDSKIHHYCMTHLSYYTIYFLLPIYFTSSGLKTNFTKLQLTPDFWLLLLVCAVATIGKISGAGIVSYCFGYSKRESLVIAILMNTRGLIELVVLNIGFTSGILNERIFSIFVIMCLFTTMMSYPLVSWIYRDEITDVKLKRRRARDNQAIGGGDEDEGGEEGVGDISEGETRSIPEYHSTASSRVDAYPTISTILKEEKVDEGPFFEDSEIQAFHNIHKALISCEDEWKHCDEDHEYDNEAPNYPTGVSEGSLKNASSPSHNFYSYFQEEEDRSIREEDMERPRSRTYAMEIDQFTDIDLSK